MLTFLASFQELTAVPPSRAQLKQFRLTLPQLQRRRQQQYLPPLADWGQLLPSWKWWGLYASPSPSQPRQLFRESRDGMLLFATLKMSPRETTKPFDLRRCSCCNVKTIEHARLRARIAFHTLSAKSIEWAVLIQESSPRLAFRCNKVVWLVSSCFETSILTYP